MSILFGHPTGNPNSHQAALAHLEYGQLAGFCVPWMPSKATLQILGWPPLLRSKVARLGRRHFGPLVRAPLIQGRIREWQRLVRRAFGHEGEALSYEANDWLMDIMSQYCHQAGVSAVHAYEDCSLLQFKAARKLGKACIYDMPIGFYPAWQATEAALVKTFVDWLPVDAAAISKYTRPQQKYEEMELADVVLVPSSVVAETILRFHPNKPVRLAPYGVDLEFWSPMKRTQVSERLRFIYAGQMSLRKGIPDLLAAWEKAAVKDAELVLVGKWNLRTDRLESLPVGVSHSSTCPPIGLRQRYRDADVFVFPSFFEGFPLVLLEAMACGLPAIASRATGAGDILTAESGMILPTGDQDALVEALRWFSENRERIPTMGQAARKCVEDRTWVRYRKAVVDATASFA